MVFRVSLVERLQSLVACRGGYVMTMSSLSPAGLRRGGEDDPGGPADGPHGHRGVPPGGRRRVHQKRRHVDIKQTSRLPHLSLARMRLRPDCC